MAISKRLKTICDLLLANKGVADVGADHGLVEKYLLDHELTPYIIAIENKIGPYTILKNALESYSNVRVSLSDGIEDIDEKVDVIIIAGMGGINIVNILNKNKEKLVNIKQIIVDSHRDEALVKETLKELGFEINKEVPLEDAKKHYNIISFLKKE